MDALKFVESSPKVPPKGMIAIYGEEIFLRQQSLSKVMQLVVGENEFGVKRFSGLNSSLADILDELNTPPLFGSCRLIVLEEADDFVTRQRQALESYLDHPSQWGVLVLLLKKFPSNTRLAKRVAKNGLSLECKAPRTYEVTRWVVQWATYRYQKQLSKALAERMVESVGSNLAMLDKELEKLASSVGASTSIQLKDIDQLVVRAAEQTSWQILDALASGKNTEALIILERLLRGGEAPIAIFGALSWHLRMLIRAGRLVQQGWPQRAALEEAGVKPFAMQRAGSHLKRIGSKRIDRLYRWLLDTDLDLKGRRPVPAQVALEQLLIKITC